MPNLASIFPACFEFADECVVISNQVERERYSETVAKHRADDARFFLRARPRHQFVAGFH
jgi:hypothetical protein